MDSNDCKNTAVKYSESLKQKFSRSLILLGVLPASFFLILLLLIIYNERDSNIHIYVAFLSLVVTLISLTIYFTTRSIHRLLAPILDFCDGLGRLAESRWEGRLPVEGCDEMTKASQTINDLCYSLKVNENKLKEVNKYKTHFLANMSHEIRTPLNAILGFTRILLKKTKSTSGMTVEHFNFLKHIESSGNNLTEVINNILDFSKIEAGRMDVACEEINIRLIVQGVYHASKMLADDKRVELSYDALEGLPEFIFSDRVKVNQILMNLIGNAIKFTPRGGKVKLSAGIDAEQVIFNVSNEAEDISQKKIELILESFEQDDRTLFTQYETTGLGFAIVKQMLTLLEGKISVESMGDVGFLFKVSIPWNRVLKAETTQSNSESEEVQFAPESLVLIVEDNPVNQQMLQALLQTMNIQVIIAENGHEGVEKVIEFKPDIVLMDIHMPLMNGYEAVKAIRQNSDLDQIPIIILSADAFVEQQQQVFASGKINGYITKPIKFDQLIHTLEKFLKIEERENEGKDLADEAISSFEKDDREKIIEGLNFLMNTPIYRGKNLIQQIKNLEELCRGKSKMILTMLERAHRAILQGHENKLKGVIEEILLYFKSGL